MTIASADSPASTSGSPSAATGNDDVARLSYEQAREQLVGVVGRLETGSVGLEESLALWERGEALAARCQSWLDDARARLAAVAQPGSDEPSSTG